MKIKYYLRGFGLGIIATAVIFAIANIFVGAGNTSATNQTAEQTTGSVLAYTKETQATTAGQSQTTAAQAGETITVATANSKETAANIAGDQKAETTPVAKNEGTTTATTAAVETLKAGQKVSVDISNIKYMYEVGDILYAKGIVTDVKEFNNYMTANGYDVKLREGTYELTAGDTFENIAKIITRS